MSRKGRKVIAECSVCGHVSERTKGRSGLGHTKNGRYCGTMRVIKELERFEH